MRMTRTTRLVLEALLAPGEHHGYELLKSTGILAGSLYPILDRFEKAGWVTGTWRQTNDNRPRRRCYRLTAAGRREAKSLS